MTSAKEQDRAARQHYEQLSRDEQLAAIRRLADQGLGDYSIAAATRLSVEIVRQVIGRRREARP